MSENPTSEIRRLIRTARNARRMSLRTLAAVTGLTSSFLSQFERGKSGANEKTIARILDGLGLRYSNLSAGPELQHRITRNDEHSGVQVTGDASSFSLDRLSPARIQVDMIAVRPGVRTLLGGKQTRRIIRYLIVVDGKISLLSEHQCLTLTDGDTFECSTSDEIQISSGDLRRAVLICISSWRD